MAENVEAQTEQELAEGGITRLYELGFHIIPTVPAEEVSQVVARINEEITGLGGEVTFQAEPEHIDLAYPIEQRHSHGGGKKQFHSAHFGWLVATMTPEAVQGLEEKLKEDENILRFLLTKTDQETVDAAREKMAAREDRGQSTEEGTDTSSEQEATEESVSEQELDRAVEEMTKQS